MRDGEGGAKGKKIVNSKYTSIYLSCNRVDGRCHPNTIRMMARRRSPSSFVVESIESILPTYCTSIRPNQTLYLRTLSRERIRLRITMCVLLRDRAGGNWEAGNRKGQKEACSLGSLACRPEPRS